MEERRDTFDKSPASCLEAVKTITDCSISAPLQIDAPRRDSFGPLTWIVQPFSESAIRLPAVFTRMFHFL